MIHVTELTLLGDNYENKNSSHLNMYFINVDDGRNYR